MIVLLFKIRDFHSKILPSVTQWPSLPSAEVSNNFLGLNEVCLMHGAFHDGERIGTVISVYIHKLATATKLITSFGN